MDKSYIRNTFFKSVGMAALLLALPLLPSCTDDEPVGQMEQVPLQLAVGIDSIASRAMITGNTFDNGSSIGIFVLDMATMSTYDGNTLHNIRYTAQDASGTQKWVSDSKTFLSGTQGAVCGYYPYSSGVSLTAVPVQSGSTDYMLGYSEGTVNASKPSTALIFSHAQHAFNINISLDNYLGDGVLTDLTLSSSKLAASKTVNLVDGSVSYTGEGTTLSVPLVNTALGSESSLAGQIMAVSTVTGTNTVDLTVTATVDGKVLTLERSDLSINMTDGYCTELNIVISGETMRLAGVSVAGWGQTDMGDKDIAIADGTLHIGGNTEGIAFSNRLNDDGTVTITAVPLEQNTIVAEASLTGTGVLEQSIDYDTGIMTAVVSDMSGEVNVTFVGVEHPIIATYYIDETKTAASRSGRYECQILSSDTYSYYFSLSEIKYMIIDDTKLTPSRKHIFTEVGEHIVRYCLADEREVPGYMFREVNSLISVDLSAKIKNIGIRAFYGCKTLKKLGLGENIETIENFAFSDCFGLTSLTIPNSVTDVGNGAFSSCTGLIDLYIGDKLQNVNWRTFYNANRLKNIVVSPNNIMLDSRNDCNAIMETATNTLIRGGNITIIPEDAEIIGQNAFSNCDGLTNITIPNSVTSIGDYAFDGCSGLTNITIPNSVTSIGNYAFSYCDGLTTLDLGTGVQTIGNNAFYQCRGLTGTLIIPNSVSSIGSYAFYDCRKLTGLILGGNVKIIGSYAFYDCRELTGELVIPNSVTSIGNSAFYLCGLTGLELGTGIETIGDYAFYNLSKLTGNNELIIPVSCISIGNDAFYCCKFKGTLNIPASCISLGSEHTAFANCMGFTHINVDDNNPNYTDLDSNVIVEKTNNILVKGSQNSTVPATFSSISKGAFYKCTGLTGLLKIPDECISIGDYAFYHCTGLEQLDLGIGVQDIGAWAFDSCSGLTGELVIPNSVTDFFFAFSDCKNITSLVTGNGVEEIGYGTFDGCSNLTSVTIGSGVTSIDKEAFKGCTKIERINSLAKTAPSIYNNTFYLGVKSGGILTVPVGATGYDVWMGTGSYYLGYYNWTMQEMSE